MQVALRAGAVPSFSSRCSVRRARAVEQRLPSRPANSLAARTFSSSSSLGLRNSAPHHVDSTGTRRPAVVDRSRMNCTDRRRRAGRAGQAVDVVRTSKISPLARSSDPASGSRSASSSRMTIGTFRFMAFFPDRVGMGRRSRGAILDRCATTRLGQSGLNVPRRGRAGRENLGEVDWLVQ